MHELLKETVNDAAAFWTALLFVATAVLMAATVFLWLVTRQGILGQGKDALHALQLSEQRLIATNRAWLKVRAAVAPGQPLIFGGHNGLQLTLEFFAENIGNAPAQFITFHASIYVHRAEPELAPMLRHRQNCEALRSTPLTAGQILWPEEHFPQVLGLGTWQMPIVIPQEEIDAAYNVTGPGRQISAFVGGCVDYTFPSNPTKHHQSRFFLRLGRVNGQPLGPDESEVTTIPGTAIQLFRDFADAQGNEVD